MKPFLRLITLSLLLLVINASSAQMIDRLPFSDYDQTQFVDVAWYQTNLIAAADLWNGGLDGESGMGTYQPDFNGFFHVNLNQQWRQTSMRSSTSIAQSRAIYMNVEAYRASGEGRFLDAINKGVEYLLSEFYDAEYGGFYWEVSPNGITRDSQKHGYGNVHPLFVLAQAYSVTQNPAHLQAALTQLGVIQTHFLDPNYACALRPGLSRDFSEVIGYNNVDGFTHLFEALLALHDVTTGDQQVAVDDLLIRCGDFLVDTLYRDQDGYSDRGYVAYHYDESWSPSQEPYSRNTQWAGAMHATTGHNIELAYLLSRAVERGFDPEWLITADKLFKFCELYALHPDYGGMIYEITDYDGQPLVGNPDNDIFVWWAQAETARALLHFVVVRDVERYMPLFKATETLFHGSLTDQEYGGLYHGLDVTQNLRPVGEDKGNVWKVNYHYTMFFSEVLRLANAYPERILALAHN
ncbi:MAG: AGE family epimerase/isomerase [bacterium]|nr:AGE family epimerase/isomerase [bacterium]